MANETIADGKPEAYFRGRRLKGRPVRVPEEYRGVVVRGEEEGGTALDQNEEADEGMEEREEEKVRALDEVARFEELVVWGHEIVPEEDDVFVKGVEEWIRFATA
ncbi:hypothetical protein MMC29_007695, partial [Sticta canariensis]|nr:hypothetical protein [Sticta canariensis]